MNYLQKSKNIDFPVFLWLLSLTILIFIIILIGGLTRLTDSGLSMVNWRPIMGIIPPLTNLDWINAFKEYKISPEFIIVNNSMELDDFKFIYWWEWFHRFFARIIGIVLIVPMLFFLIKKRISKKLLISLLILLLFGIFQAVIGWWMVKSGLNENPYVSPYRLAFHLSNAIIILSILFWLTLNIWNNLSLNFLPKNYLEIITFILFFFLITTIISGAFMAGTNAGQSFNTFPLMNGKIIPEDYFLLDNNIRNFFENTVAINFNHRWLASITFIAIILLAFYLYYKKIFIKNLPIKLIVFFSFFQFLLGIITLLSNVKIIYASMHQMNSVILLISLLYTYHSIKKERLI